MSRDEDLIFNIGPERPELQAGEILPSDRTIFLAKKIFLFCEGKTEFHYFSRFKEDMVSSRLEIIPRYPDQEKREGPDVKKLTEQVLGSIIEKKVIVAHDGNRRSFNFEKMDECHIIFDCDNNFKVQIDGGSKYEKSNILAENMNISFHLSNYSFEVWILCHFKNLVGIGRMKNTGLKREILHSSGWDDYKKGDAEIYSKTKDKIVTAKKNSSDLIRDRRKNGIEIKSEDSNPVTEIGELIEYLEDQIIQ